MKLIVNADDFGYSKGVNLGIIEAHRKGIVSSATMMTNMYALDHAVQLAKNNPSLGVGIHLVLTCGVPLSKRKSSLTDEHGRFLRNRELVAQAKTEDVEQELLVQIEQFLATGLIPTHLDSHHHVHTEAAILPVVLRLAEKFHLPVRNPLSTSRHRENDSMLAEVGTVGTTERFLHQFYGNELTIELLISQLQELDGCETAELMCHPAYLDEELLVGSSYNRPRARELHILTSPIVKEYIKQSQIQLTTFDEIR